MVAMGIFPFKEKSPWQNRESISSVISSQILWPLDHEAGHDKLCLMQKGFLDVYREYDSFHSSPCALWEYDIRMNFTA
jgi:hypothetical protein